MSFSPQTDVNCRLRRWNGSRPHRVTFPPFCGAVSWTGIPRMAPNAALLVRGHVASVQWLFRVETARGITDAAADPQKMETDLPMARIGWGSDRSNRIITPPRLRLSRVQRGHRFRDVRSFE
jgi:hypothetical protein